MPSRDLFFAALGSLPAAVALLTALRWPDHLICPYCGSADVGGHGCYWRHPALPRYQCHGCDRTFLLTTGTPLARSRVPLPGGVVVAWLILLGVSASCARRESDQPYDRVNALMWRLIEAAIGRETGHHLSGTVDVEEIHVSCGRNERARAYWEPTCLLLASLLGRGPAPAAWRVRRGGPDGTHAGCGVRRASRGRASWASPSD